MIRLLRVALLSAFLLFPAMAPAQQPGGDDTSISRGTKLDPADQKPEGKEQPVFAYLLAIIGSGGILFIVCSPARKS